MSIKKAYYYFFYVFYKSSRKLGSFYPYDFVAGVIMIALEIWFVLSCVNYYSIISNNNFKISFTSPIIIISFIIIIVINSVTLIYYNNVWKSYNREFDKISNRKNLLGGIIVWIIALVIFVVFFMSAEYLHKKFKIGDYNPEFIAKEKLEDSLQKAKQIEYLKKVYGDDKKK